MKPTEDDLERARRGRLPDVRVPRGGVLFVGINPSLYSAAVGHHFARPGNRFWPALHLAGLTPRRFDPTEDRELPELGMGLTNVVARPTARADEVSLDELIAGRETLLRKVRRLQPAAVAIVGVTAFRSAWRRPKAQLGEQAEDPTEDLAGARLWVLPNPSGLNAHYQVPRLAQWYANLRPYVRASVSST